MRTSVASFYTFTLLTIGVPAVASTNAPPVARRDVVVDTTFGLRLEDPYRWMETPDNAEFRSWLLAQGDAARARLDAIPGRKRLSQRLKELSLETSGPGSLERRAGKLFYLRVDPRSTLPKLIVRDANGHERVLLDPAQRRGADSVHVSIDNFSISWDGALVAVNLAEGGSEVTRVHVMDVATGVERSDVVEHIWGQFPVVWLPDGSGFFYTQMSDAGFRDPNVDPILGMRVRRHLLGTPPEQDPVFLAPDSSSSLPIEPREFPVIQVPIGARYAIAICVGAHPELRAYVAPLETVRPGTVPWQEVCGYEDSIADLAAGTESLDLLSHRGAPNGRILRVPVAHPDLATAVEVVPQSDRILEEMVHARDGLYTLQAEAGVDHLYRIAGGSRVSREIPLPLAGTCSELDGALDEDGILFSMTGWTRPAKYYRYLPREARVRDTGMGTHTPADYSGITSERVLVKSFDGTMVPLTILRASSFRRDKSHPALVNGYGAYGSSIRPSFSASRLAWLERGGILAYAHVRGGGEKGEAWHQAGQGANKKNAVGDFIACSEYLVAKGYTSPARLAATGSSGGGPLVAGAMVKRPDLFAAVVLYNTVLNTVRYLHGTNGANQIPEMGSPETEEGYRALAAMDPTLAVRERVRYPAVLACVGLNDRRVSQWHSGKFVARLQASGSAAPVFLRVEPEAGHGVGSTRDQGIELMADTYSFLMWRFGDPAFAPPQP